MSRLPPSGGRSPWKRSASTGLPSPQVTETFTASESADNTRLEHSGELGTDLGALEAWWGRAVAHYWESAVLGHPGLGGKRGPAA
jgi:hypothetical protein